MCYKCADALYSLFVYESVDEPEEWTCEVCNSPKSLMVTADRNAKKRQLEPPQGTGSLKPCKRFKVHSSLNGNNGSWTNTDDHKKNGGAKVASKSAKSREQHRKPKERKPPAPKQATNIKFRGKDTRESPEEYQKLLEDFNANLTKSENRASNEDGVPKTQEKPKKVPACKFSFGETAKAGCGSHYHLQESEKSTDKVFDGAKRRLAQSLKLCKPVSKLVECWLTTHELCLQQNGPVMHWHVDKVGLGTLGNLPVATPTTKPPAGAAVKPPPDPGLGESATRESKPEVAEDSAWTTVGKGGKSKPSKSPRKKVDKGPSLPTIYEDKDESVASVANPLRKREADNDITEEEDNAASKRLKSILGLQKPVDVALNAAKSVADNVTADVNEHVTGEVRGDTTINPLMSLLAQAAKGDLDTDSESEEGKEDESDGESIISELSIEEEKAEEPVVPARPPTFITNPEEDNFSVHTVAADSDASSVSTAISSLSEDSTKSTTSSGSLPPIDTTTSVVIAINVQNQDTGNKTLYESLKESISHLWSGIISQSMDNITDFKNLGIKTKYDIKEKEKTKRYLLARILTLGFLDKYAARNTQSSIDVTSGVWNASFETTVWANLTVHLTKEFISQQVANSSFTEQFKFCAGRLWEAATKLNKDYAHPDNLERTIWTIHHVINQLTLVQLKGVSAQSFNACSQLIHRNNKLGVF